MKAEGISTRDATQAAMYWAVDRAIYGQLDAEERRIGRGSVYWIVEEGTSLVFLELETRVFDRYKVGCAGQSHPGLGIYLDGVA